MTLYASSNHFSDNDESTPTARLNAALLREPNYDAAVENLTDQWRIRDLCDRLIKKYGAMDGCEEIIARWWREF